MNKIHFTYIFQVLGILAVFFSCFLGLNYMTKGNIILSSIGSFVIILVLFGSVYLMMQGKERKDNEGITAKELLAFILYGVFAVGSFFVIRHFINVDYLLKDDIKTISINKLDENEEMFKQYEEQVEATLDIIDTNLRNAVMKSKSGLRDTFALNGVDPSRISNYTTERKNIREANEKRAKKGLVSLEQDFLTFKLKKEKVVQDWEQFKLHRTLLEIDDKYDNTLATLQELFKAPEQNEAWNRFSFQYPSIPRQDGLLENPKALVNEFKPNILKPLLGILLIHFFILMPYLFMERLGIQVIYRKKLKEKVDTVDV